MGHPVRGLDAAQLERFFDGLAAFDAPLSSDQGLGPIFNEPACGSCHNHPTSGGSGVRAVTRFGKAGPPFDDLANLGGSLLQDQALDPVNCGEVVPPEADVTAQRLTPICFGAGLLEAIDDADIVANETNGGTASWVGDLSDPNLPRRPARLGWKGVLANALSFSIDASLNEMGLTSIFLPDENAPNGDLVKLAACDGVVDPEDLPDAFGKTRIDRFTDFQRFLAAPPQTPRSGMSGETLFAQVGCATCHRPSYVTGSAPEAALSQQAIRPYSDFLLHDMGNLGDRIVQGNADETHHLTRALWGLAHRVSFLHDGRVTGGTFRDNMIACVQEHDGDAAGSAAAFLALSTAEQDQVVAFLQSLGRAEFDYELDNDLDEFDWFFIEPFLTGPGSFYTPDSPEAFCDADQDGDFDLVDVSLVQIGFTDQTSEAAAHIPVLEPVSALDLVLLAGGSKKVTVGPGGIVHYELRGELTDPDVQGLALFAVDLAFDGGPLATLDPPAVQPMLNFVGPLGLTNPSGFGGTTRGGELRQVGGAQNAIDADFGSFFKGSLILDVAARGNRTTLARGSLVAPMVPGTYELEILNPTATAVLADASGSEPFWRVGPVSPGKLGQLSVTVVPGGPQVYCTGKPSSEGCTPQMTWRGVPTLSGPDDFTLRCELAVPGQWSVFVWGSQSASIPYQGGTLCVGGSLVRTKPSKSEGGPCSGVAQFDFRQNYMSQHGLMVGSQVFAQAWMRDPAHPDGTKTGLSDGLAFEILP